MDEHPEGTDVPPTMNAVRLHAAGDPTAIAYERIETPNPGAGEAIVRVHAAAITRDELEWPADRLPATPSYEFSGVVAAIGEGVDAVAVGDTVCALVGFDRDGAAAEFVAMEQEVLAPKPETLGHVEAAAVPLAGLSAWQGLFHHGKLVEGERVLVHGAAGGVGGFAVQLARALGADVIGVVSTANVKAARELALERVIDHGTTRFEDMVDRVDLVFDTVGGDRLERSLAVLDAGGRLVSVASEPSKEQAATLGIEAIYFVVEPNSEQLRELAALIDRGQVRPTVDAVFPLREARQAFERSLGGNRRGKIVLLIGEEG